MKTLWMIPCAALLASALWADEPAADAPPAAPALSAAEESEATEESAAPNAGCPPCVTKVCVPEPAKKKTVTPWYDCVSKDYCLPRCPWPACWFGKKRCGEGAPCTECGPPRTRNVLVKKLAVKETDTVKCVPKTIAAPACAAEGECSQPGK